MNAARADALWAQRQLDQFGWIARNAESFRHLPPPPAAVWLRDTSEHLAGCAATALEGAGWNLQPIGALPQGRVDARWLDAADPAQRAELFAGLALPDDGDAAAPFSWAHRSLCRRGLRLRMEAGDGTTPTVWLQLRHTARNVVDAPMLVVDVQPGVRCVLVEVHERESSSCQCALVQNLHVHLRLSHGSTLQHLRIVTPGADDRLAHHVHVRVEGDARYDQALLASGSSYHLQRSVFELQGTRATAQAAAVLLAAGNTLEQQVRTHHKAPQTHSSVDVLTLADGDAQVVVNAFTHIAPGSDDADVRQRLNGIATGGEPKIVLRPHLEIHHDQVQAAHGATVGALDEEALFYAGQRGLSAPLARTLMVEGMARAVLSRGLEAGEWMNHLDIDPLLARQVQRHLGSTMEVSHG